MASNQLGKPTSTSSNSQAWARGIIEIMREEGRGVGQSIHVRDLQKYSCGLIGHLNLRAVLDYAIEAGWLLPGKFDDSVSLTQRGFAL
jgi:hypothetical protein